MKQETTKVEAAVGQFPTEGCPLTQLKPIFLQEKPINPVQEDTSLCKKQERQHTQVSREGSKCTQMEKNPSQQLPLVPGRLLVSSPRPVSVHVL